MTNIVWTSTLTSYLKNHWFETWTYVTTRDNSTTDASSQFGNGALYYNLEIKVEKGSGHGDPYMQSMAYITSKIFHKQQITIQYPFFLLELCGTAFSVSGIVNTEKQVICDPLSPTYQLLCNQEFIMTLQMTKLLFASLRKNLITLRSHEFNGSLSPVSPFPFVSSFSDRILKRTVQDSVPKENTGFLVFYPDSRQ